MKKLVYILIMSLYFSCEIPTPYNIYGEPDSLSLSGEYIIDRITVTSTENTSGTPLLVVYEPGDIYIGGPQAFPLDRIVVGGTRWHFDYASISISPIGNYDGTVDWQYSYFYHVYYDLGDTYVYDTNYGWIYKNLGYIEFRLLNGSIRRLHIINDGVESLTLRTTGEWPDGPFGSNKSVTLQLTRVGP